MTDYSVLLGRDDSVDVTERVECYAKGKTWTCPCGSDMWGYHDTKHKKCFVCGDINVDTEAEEREAPSTEDGQMTFGAF